MLPLLVMSQFLIASFQKHYFDEQWSQMYRKANTIATDIVVSGFFNDENKSYLGTIKALTDGRTRIINQNGSVVFDSNYLETGKLYASEGILEALKGQSKNYYSAENNAGKVVVPIYQLDSKEILGAVLITNSFENITEAMDDLKRIASLIAVCIVVVIIPLSFWSATILTNPLKRLIRYITGITEGHIDDKSTIKGYNEIEEISVSFNRMIHKLFEVEDNRQQFVANVSHELKTPLSSVKVLAESLLSQENVPVEIYREFLEDINNEVDREAKIINDLLTLVTLDKKDNNLNISAVNINDLVEAILKRLKPLAGKKNIQMIYESYRSIIAEVDETKLSLAISNLIENAIKYNEDFGLITTTLNADHKDFELVVKDTGIGIPEDSIDKIFERFYRVDKMRARDTGGTGLGLSIVQKSVMMHSGTVKCESVLDKGTKFIVRIPLKHIT